MQPHSSPGVGESIGERLKRLRLEQGLSQRELAAPGVSYAYISRIEAGTRQPSVKALRRLAAKLNVSADYLETGSDLDAASARELRLSELELAARLGEHERVAEPLTAELQDAVAAGDRPAALRARVLLARLSLEAGENPQAVALLEDALVDEPFLPVDRFDLYASLGRAYTGSGYPERAAELYRACLDQVTRTGGDDALAARYGLLLGRALSDAGDAVEAERVVGDAFEHVGGDDDPYTRVRLYAARARRARRDGRESDALENGRRAIALLEATDDAVQLARAHVLAADVAAGRDDSEAAAGHLAAAERLLGPHPAQEDALDLEMHRSRVALAQERPVEAVEHARRAIELAAKPVEEGLALSALADGLVATGEHADASTAYARAVELLEQSRRWRSASAAGRAWGRLLRHQGREAEALDVLDRAAELGMRATGDVANAER